MPKPSLEFREPAGTWRAVPAVDGLEELILSEDADTGECTKLLRYAPGTDTSRLGPLRHEFWEEAWIVSGSARDAGTGATLTAGMYACRAPGMAHGPFVSTDGCLMLEVRYRTR